MKRIALVAVLMFGHATSAWAGFDEGMAAYERGDYATALEEWLPLAEQGNVAAQSNLGVMYTNGHGVPQNYAEAAKWYRAAFCCNINSLAVKKLLGKRAVLD